MSSQSLPEQAYTPLIFCETVNKEEFSTKLVAQNQKIFNLQNENTSHLDLLNHTTSWSGDPSSQYNWFQSTDSNEYISEMKEKDIVETDLRKVLTENFQQITNKTYEIAHCKGDESILSLSGSHSSESQHLQIEPSDNDDWSIIKNNIKIFISDEEQLWTFKIKFKQTTENSKINYLDAHTLISHLSKIPLKSKTNDFFTLYAITQISSDRIRNLKIVMLMQKYHFETCQYNASYVCGSSRILQSNTYFLIYFNLIVPSNKIENDERMVHKILLAIPNKDEFRNFFKDKFLLKHAGQVMYTELSSICFQKMRFVILQPSLIKNPNQKIKDSSFIKTLFTSDDFKKRFCEPRCN